MKGETKLDRERRLKKELPLEMEKVEYTGMEGKEGDKWAKEVLKEEEQKEKKKKERLIEQLYSISKVDTYNRHLYDMLRGFLSLIQSDWKFHVAYDQVGIIMELKSPKGKYFRSAFKPTGDPELDVNAVQVFALRAENTIDRVEQRDAQPAASGDGKVLPTD